MELKKYQFSVNTANKCFLCFGETDLTNFSNYYEHSMHTILRCLKINLTELHSLSSKSPSLLNKTDFKIRLCSECALIIQKFSKEYETLEVYKMIVASSLEVIKTKLSEVMPKIEAVKEEDAKFLKHCKIVEELRTKMVKKCEIKIKQVLPKVRIEKIDLKDVEMKQRTVSPVLSESAPIVALEVKLEPTYSADEIRLEDSIFNSDLQTETFEIFATSVEISPCKKRVKKLIKVANPSSRKVYVKKCKNQRHKDNNRRSVVTCPIKPEPPQDPNNFNDPVSIDFQNETVQPAEILKISESEFNFHCEICEERFKNKQALVTHKQIHKNKDELFYCNFCGAGCCSEDRLRIHQRKVHTDKNLSCSVCPKTFPSKTVLKNHEKTHLQARPFKCTFINCGMTYATKDVLAIHMKVHSEELPWKCQNCGKGFAFKDKLQRHSQIHFEERSRVKCSLCPASFLHRKNLIIHTRNVHGLALRTIESFSSN